MNSQSEIYEALQLAAVAMPNPQLWSGPASSAMSLRIEHLDQVLQSLVGQFETLTNSSSASWVWSSLSLFN